MLDRIKLSLQSYETMSMTDHPDDSPLYGDLDLGIIAMMNSGVYITGYASDINRSDSEGGGDLKERAEKDLACSYYMALYNRYTPEHHTSIQAYTELREKHYGDPSPSVDIPIAEKGWKAMNRDFWDKYTTSILYGAIAGTEGKLIGSKLTLANRLTVYGIAPRSIVALGEARSRAESLTRKLLYWKMRDLSTPHEPTDSAIVSKAIWNAFDEVSRQMENQRHIDPYAFDYHIPATITRL